MSSRSNKSASGKMYGPRAEAAKERGRKKRKAKRLSERHRSKAQKLPEDESIAGRVRGALEKKAKRIKTALGR